MVDHHRLALRNVRDQHTRECVANHFAVPPSTSLGGTGGAPPTPSTLMRNQRRLYAAANDRREPRTVPGEFVKTDDFDLFWQVLPKP